MAKTLPFSHAYTKLTQGDNVQESAKISLNNYQRLLNSLNLGEGWPYNLLMTREWMLVIPRSQPCYQNIGINSLGFAGGLLVRNQDELDFVKKHQPLNILKAVGVTL
jgi:ATP adenylyltransferase